MEHAAGGAAALHARGVPDAPVRAAAFLSVERPALVLGSTQPESDLDASVAAARGIDVTRRRSGGGAVLLTAGDVVWVDVTLPRGDPLWQDDVGRAFWWLGDTWEAALDALGVSGLDVHRGPLVRTPLSPKVCFAGLGPGELTVAGRKVVGISQRRTRTGALFQCALLLRWDPELVGELLRVDVDTLRHAAAGVGVEQEAVRTAFLAALSEAGGH